MHTYFDISKSLQNDVYSFVRVAWLGRTASTTSNQAWRVRVFLRILRQFYFREGPDNMAGFVCSAVFVGQQSANTFLCEENRVSVDFVKSRRAATNAASYRVVGTRPLEVFMCDAQPPTEGTRFQRWVGNRKKLASRLREYGLAAVISYGLFDAVTYAVSLFLAIRGYLAAGKVLTLQSAPQVFLAMWCVFSKFMTIFPRTLLQRY